MTKKKQSDSLLVTTSYDSLVMMMSSDRTPACRDTERQDADTGVIMLWIIPLCSEFACLLTDVSYYCGVAWLAVP